MAAVAAACQTVRAARREGNDEALVAALVSLSEAYAAEGRKDEAVQAATQALARGKKVGQKALQATGERAVKAAQGTKAVDPLAAAETVFKAGKFSEAVAAAKAAFDDAQKSGDVAQQVGLLCLMSGAYVEVRKPRDAVSSASAALKLAKEKADKACKATSLCALAKAKLALSEVGEAIDAAAEAAAVAKQAGKTDLETNAWLVLAKASQDPSAAQHAVQLAKASGNKSSLGAAYFAEAEILMAKSQFEEGVKALQSAEMAYSEVGNEDGIEASKIAMAKAQEVSEPLPSKQFVPREPVSAFHAKPIMGSGQTYTCAGQVAVVTGASRGIGKGIAEELARAGAIVYVTGRSTAGASTDQLLGGTVDETAQMVTKSGGSGIALHMDHSFNAENKALASLLRASNMRVDVLVNNAFYIPKPDQLFFSTPVWKQPLRYLDEQFAVGGFCHTAAVVNLADCLRRGKGLVVNISSWGAHHNIGAFPVSYFLNKAAFDQAQSALAAYLQRHHISVITLYPGSVRSERSALATRRAAGVLSDAEGTRFTGRAIVALARAPATTLQRLARRTILSADVCAMDGMADVDGYVHEPDQITIQVLK